MKLSYLVFVAAFEHPPLSVPAWTADLEAELDAAVPLPATPLALEQALGRLCIGDQIRNRQDYTNAQQSRRSRV